jgi:hypothetical protein
LEGAAGVFGSDARTEPVARAIDVKTLRDLLGAEGVRVGRLHVATLMKKMGVAAIYRRPNTSKPEPRLFAGGAARQLSASLAVSARSNG